MGEVRPDTSGISTIVTTAVFSTSEYSGAEMAPIARPVRASTNENSPTWKSASAAASGTTFRYPNAHVIPKNTPPFSRLTTATTRATVRQLPSTWPGSSSMPTDAKNSRLNTSRSGMMSLSAWWLYSDSLSTRPATNAPTADDVPTACDR